MHCAILTLGELNAFCQISQRFFKDIKAKGIATVLTAKLFTMPSQQRMEMSYGDLVRYAYQHCMNKWFNSTRIDFN